MARIVSELFFCNNKQFAFPVWLRRIPLVYPGASLECRSGVRETSAPPTQPCWLDGSQDSSRVMSLCCDWQLWSWCMLACASVSRHWKNVWCNACSNSLYGSFWLCRVPRTHIRSPWSRLMYAAVVVTGRSVGRWPVRGHWPWHGACVLGPCRDKNTARASCAVSVL